MARIYNGCNHPITIIDGAHPNPNAKIRKLCGGTEIMRIPENEMLNVHQRFVMDQERSDAFGMPVFTRRIDSIDPLPEGEWDVIIVSVQYASAYVAMYGNDPRLYTVSQPVMSKDGETHRGCCGINQFCVTD